MRNWRRYVDKKFFSAWGFLVFGICYSFHNVLTIIFGIVLAGVLLYLAILDFYEGMLYDRIVFPLAFLGIVYVLLGYLLGDIVNTMTHATMGAIVGCGFFGILRLATGGVGGGDVKLAGVLGIWLGLNKLLVALMIAFLLGGSLAAFLLVTAKKERKDSIPFGPFLSIGGYLAFILGDKVIDWYLSFM